MESQKFNSSSIFDLKQRWRIHLKKIREELPFIRQEQASLKANQKLSERCKKACLVLSFASFGSEINLWPFNQELIREGRLVLPLIVMETLQLFRVNDFNQLEIQHWGILEPKASICSPVDISLIEIALIPGLGFDLKTKHRLGYGKGYYDKLLKKKYSLYTWGIGFLEQAVERLPYSKNDIPLDQIYLF